MALTEQQAYAACRRIMRPWSYEKVVPKDDCAPFFEVFINDQNPDEQINICTTSSDSPEDEAVVKLIASAPRLLQCLKLAHNALKECAPNAYEYTSAYVDIVEAINKATK